MRLITFIFLITCFSLAPAVSAKTEPTVSADAQDEVYQISVGDSLNIYVWRNPELSITVPVRPDGRISLPLVDDIQATEKSPVQLAKEIEKILSKFIKQPNVSVIVVGFGETLQSSIKIIGNGLKPTAIPYSKQIRLLDIIIKMGGLPGTASTGTVKIIRQIENDQAKEIKVNLGRLINKGDISQNIKMQRGDILVISEKWF